MIFYKSKKHPIYATVWNVEELESGNLAIQITTSEKDEDGEYVKSSIWFPLVVGNAIESLEGLERGMQIAIYCAKFRNRSRDDYDDNRIFFNMYIIDAQITGAVNLNEDDEDDEDDEPIKKANTKIIKKPVKKVSNKTSKKSTTKKSIKKKPSKK